MSAPISGRRYGSGSINKGSLGCLYLFLAPFVIAGIALLIAGFQSHQKGYRHDPTIKVVAASILLIGSVAFLFHGRRCYRRGEALERLRSERPDEPWLLNPDWADGVIRSSITSQVKAAWGLAIVVLGISSPLLFAFQKEWEKGNKAIAIGLIFPLIGLCLLWWAIYATLQWRKFGTSSFRLLKLPGVIGGVLSGVIDVPAKVRADKGFKVCLVCIQRVVTGSGKNQSTRETVVWEDDKVIIKDLLQHERARTGIPVHFSIPIDQPESLDGNPAILWRLSVSADIPGVDFSAQFEVPVFKTAESRADLPPAPDPTASFQVPAEDYEPPRNSPIRVRSTADGVEVYFPPGRNPLSTIGLLLFAAIWTGAIWFMIVKKAPIFFPIVFGLFDVLILLIVLTALFYSTRVIATPSRLKIFYRMVVPTATRDFDTSEIESIQVSPGTQSGTRTWYRVDVKTRDGRRHCLGDGIPDKRHAEWLANAIRQSIRL